MKEQTYGWYPSVNDIYESKNRPSSYHLQCLYKYQDSNYYQGKVSPPQPELFVSGRAASTTNIQRPSSSQRKPRSVSVPKFKATPKLNLPTPSQVWSANRLAETHWGLVGEASVSPVPRSELSWPLAKDQNAKTCNNLQEERNRLQQEVVKSEILKQKLLKDQIEQKRQNYVKGKTEPQYAWGLQKDTDQRRETVSPCTSQGLYWPHANPKIPQRPKTSNESPRKVNSARLNRPASSTVKFKTSQSINSRVGSPSIKEAVMATKTNMAPSTAGSSSGSVKKHARIQSATVNRSKTSLPIRPQTAASSYKDERVHIESYQATNPSPKPPSRPVAPVPYIQDGSDLPSGMLGNESTTPEVIELKEDNYDEMVEKYGWRAQVHGDPYGLKRAMPRLSYTVKCDDPEILPDCPTFHYGTNEPFFYNSLPSRPMTFVVDKDWMSEVLLAKRLELQKRKDGIKYNYKNFSFVY